MYIYLQNQTSNKHTNQVILTQKRRSSDRDLRKDFRLLLQISLSIKSKYFGLV